MVTCIWDFVFNYVFVTQVLVNQTLLELLIFTFAVGLRRPSSSSAVVHTFEQKYLQDKLANFSQILSVASLRRGKGCFLFWDRIV